MCLIFVCLTGWERVLELINVKSLHILQEMDIERIEGMTTLNSQFYVVLSGSQQVDIYNTSDFTKTGHVTVSDMNRPFSLVGSSLYNCLYISAECCNTNYYNDDE